MHVVVVGCGRVGARLAAQLERDGHTVAVVDRRSSAFTRLPEGTTCARVVGVGFDRDRLREAGVERADAVVAVTGGDNSNVLAARVARDAFGVERVVARIYDPRRAEIYERLGIPTVATVQWTTDRVLRHILADTSTSADWTDPTASVELLERQLPSSWAARRMGELEELSGARTVAISRNGVTFLPEVSTVVQEGDTAWFAVDRDGVDKLDTALTAVASTGGHH